MALVLTFPEGRQEAIELPERMNPHELMEERGAILVETYDSLAHANWRIASNPNINPQWI